VLFHGKTKLRFVDDQVECAVGPMYDGCPVPPEVMDSTWYGVRLTASAFACTYALLPSVVSMLML